MLNQLYELRKLAIRQHRYCEDAWYSCPKDPEGCANDSNGDECNCGVDNHNKKVEELCVELIDWLKENQSA